MQLQPTARLVFSQVTNQAVERSPPFPCMEIRICGKDTFRRLLLPPFVLVATQPRRPAGENVVFHIFRSIITLGPSTPHCRRPPQLGSLKLANGGKWRGAYVTKWIAFYWGMLFLRSTGHDLPLCVKITAPVHVENRRCE